MDSMIAPTSIQTVQYKPNTVEDQSSRVNEEKTFLVETTNIYSSYIRFGDKLSQLEMNKQSLNTYKDQYNKTLKEVKDAATVLNITGSWDNLTDEILL